jgi:hypothetical protein
MKQAVFAIALVLAVQPAEAQRRASPRPPAMRVGTCVRTTIAQVSQRLEDSLTHQVIPGSGSAVTFANGLYQVSYDQVPAVNRSRRGDPVSICLRSLPEHCPPGDVRGKFYETTNLRTRESWTLPDSEHGCGGA